MCIFLPKGGKSKHGAGHQWVLADCDSVVENGGNNEEDKRGGKAINSSNDSDECDPAALILSQVRFDCLLVFQISNQNICYRECNH